MADEPDNLVLVILRRLDAKMDRVIDDLRDVKVRLTSVKEGLNVVQRRIDRLEDRVEHIERRLDLSGPMTPGFAE
jgi:archaellum component FlaC